MAYINTKILKQHNLNLQQVSLLQILHQNKTEDMSELLESYNGDLDVLNEKGLLSEVKAKSKQESVYKRLRLSKKGSELLNNLSIVDIDEDSLKIYDWIAEIYKQSGKELGNQKKTKQFIAQFSKESGIHKNSLAFLIQSFVNDESQFEWSKVLQYLFFKGDSVFAIRFDLHSSKLYQYYLKNENYFLEKFKKWEE
jgi:hypothetical protein